MSWPNWASFSLGKKKAEREIMVIQTWDLCPKRSEAFLSLQEKKWTVFANDTIQAFKENVKNKLKEININYDIDLSLDRK